jgi:SAM-dependent methyltransferase
MALPFPADRFDAAVMALVLVFVPEPAKGIEEMVRVVRPGGTVATYMWDMLGGGFPLDPILVEMHTMGFMPPRHPRWKRLEWKCCMTYGQEPVSGLLRRGRSQCVGRSRISMTFGGPTLSPLDRGYNRFDGTWRRRDAQEPGARTPSPGHQRTHHLQCTRARDYRSPAKVTESAQSQREAGSK